jgi:hypothetical protein
LKKLRSAGNSSALRINVSFGSPLILMEYELLSIFSVSVTSLLEFGKGIRGISTLFEINSDNI